MNPAYYTVFFVLFLIFMLRKHKRKKAIIAQRIIKRKKESTVMKEVAEKFIGKECLIYTVSENQITGIIKEISGNAILIENKGNLEAVNLDFIVRIREYPTDKNGKKKSVVFD